MSLFRLGSEVAVDTVKSTTTSIISDTTKSLLIKYAVIGTAAGLAYAVLSSNNDEGGKKKKNKKKTQNFYLPAPIAESLAPDYGERKEIVKAVGNKETIPSLLHLFAKTKGVRFAMRVATALQNIHGNSSREVFQKIVAAIVGQPSLITALSNPSEEGILEAVQATIVEEDGKEDGYFWMKNIQGFEELR